MEGTVTAMRRKLFVLVLIGLAYTAVLLREELDRYRKIASM